MIFYIPLGPLKVCCNFVRLPRVITIACNSGYILDCRLQVDWFRIHFFRLQNTERRLPNLYQKILHFRLTPVYFCRTQFVNCATCRCRLFKCSSTLWLYAVLNKLYQIFHFYLTLTCSCWQFMVAQGNRRDPILVLPIGMLLKQ